MPLASTERPKKVWVNFLPNVDLGHLLTMIGFAGAMVIQWQAFDRRLTIVEEQNKMQDIALTAYRTDTREGSQEIKSDIKDIKASVGQIQQAMALAQYQLNQRQNNGQH